MSIRNKLVLSVALAAFASPALAEMTQIWVDTAPPAARVETVPPARTGYVWSPGYWSWQNGQHVWTEGRWVEARAGSHWDPDHWEKIDGRWRFFPGQWID